MTSLVLYGSNVVDTTLANACDMASATGGVETSNTTTTIGFAGGVYGEILSRGGSSTGVSSIPATPTGRGWVFSPGAGSFATGNWSAIVTISSNSWGGSSANTDITIRFFKYSGGTYTSIGSLPAKGITSTSKTTYSFTATSLSSVTFASGDLLYVDLWWHDTNTTINNDNPVIYVSTSSAQGVANDMQITTSNFTATNPVGGSYTQYDLTVYKEQMVLVYDQSGNFIDCVRDAPVLSGFKESINAVTSSLKIVLPRKFEQIDLPGQTNSHGIMQQGYVWKYYLFGPGLPSSGLLRYSGQVDEYAPQIAENGQETIAITLTPQGSAIADSGLGATLSFGTAGSSGTYVDPITQFNYWFQNNDPVTGQTYCYPLTLDPSNPSSSGVTTQFTYTNQTIKSIFDNIILMLPSNYFYRTNPDNTVTLNQTPVTAQHVLQVGVHILNPQYSQSWIQTQTAVFFLGGNDSNGNPIIAIKRGVDMQTIGKRLYLHNESRVTDQATANTLAQGDLNYYDQPMLRTKIRIPDFRGPNPSIGYDIESIKVGDSIQIQDNTYNGASTTWDNSLWDTGIWDQSPGPALNTVGVVTAINYGFYWVDCEIGLPQPNLARAVSALQQKMQDFTLL